MSMTETRSEASAGAGEKHVDLKLEVVVIPVSDVDRAKEFYLRLGWRLDADFAFDNAFRVVQFTPPGSGCSIQFGSKITSATPGSAQGLYLVVSDVQAARDELASHGVDVGEVFHPETPGAQFHTDDKSGRVNGPAPDHASYSSFATVQRPGLQRLAAPGDHHTATRTSRARRDGFRLGGRPGERASARRVGARRAREAERAGGRELAGLVRRVHRG